jgi:hypothetical protein
MHALKATPPQKNKILVDLYFLAVCLCLGWGGVDGSFWGF